MFSLRFQRQGKKRDFVFRVVAIDSRFAINSGKAKEVLGWWDPRRDTFNLKKERILYWLKQGAQPSDSCYNLLVRAKIIEGKKRVIKIKSKKKKEAAGQAEETKPEKAEEPKAEIKTEEASSENPTPSEQPAAETEKTEEKQEEK